MRLSDDDELYGIDQTYLGPPGRFIHAMRYTAIGAWVVIGPLLFVTMRRVDIPLTFLSVGLALLVTTRAASWVADHATSERPIRSLFATASNELTAARPDTRTAGTTATRFTGRVRPGGALGRWVARSSRPATEAVESADDVDPEEHLVATGRASGGTTNRDDPEK